MFTIRIFLEGAVTIQESRMLSDEKALPLFVKLKQDLFPNERPSRAGTARSKNGAPSGATGDDPSAAESSSEEPLG